MVIMVGNYELFVLLCVYVVGPQAAQVGSFFVLSVLMVVLASKFDHKALVKK